MNTTPRRIIVHVNNDMDRAKALAYLLVVEEEGFPDIENATLPDIILTNGDESVAMMMPFGMWVKFFYVNRMRDQSSLSSYAGAHGRELCPSLW